MAAAALAAVLGLVWAGGGFADRQDRITPVAPGSTIEAGPYRLSFGQATVQYKRDSQHYQVVLLGTGQTSADTSIAPPAGSNGIVWVRAAGSHEIEPVEPVVVGAGRELSLLSTDTFSPGLPPVPLQAKATLTDAPGDEVLVTVFEQEYGKAYVLSDERDWRTTPRGHDFILPLRRLPDADY